MKSTIEREMNETLAELTKRIRQGVDELDRMHRDSGIAMNRLRVNVVKWIDGQIAVLNVRTKHDAAESLADICKRKTATVLSWYQAGQTIIANDFDPDSVCSKSISYLRSMSCYLTTSGRLKVVQMIRDRAPVYKVVKILKDARREKRAGCKSRLIDLEKKGLLTKQALKIELMAIQTAARSLFKREDISVAIIDGRFKTLLGVGENAI